MKRGLALGLMYGFTLGMAAAFGVVQLEHQARRSTRAPGARVVILTERKLA